MHLGSAPIKRIKSIGFSKPLYNDSKTRKAIVHNKVSTLRMIKYNPNAKAKKLSYFNKLEVILHIENAKGIKLGNSTQNKLGKQDCSRSNMLAQNYLKGY